MKAVVVVSLLLLCCFVVSTIGAGPAIRAASASIQPRQQITQVIAHNEVKSSLEEVTEVILDHHDHHHDHPLGRGCGTVEYNEWLDNKYPERGTSEQFEATMQRLLDERRRGLHAAREPTYPVTINTVVNVIHNGEAVGSGSNIADSQIANQISVLNDDYRKMGAGAGTGVDTQINFVLSQIRRFNRNTMGWTAPPYLTAYIDSVIKPSTILTPELYMNLWSLDLGNNLLGYAQFPSSSGLQGLADNGGSADTDGVVILYKAFGTGGVTVFPYNGGRTATHEVGHFLGLRHIWGDGTTCAATDYCADTPPCDKPNYECTANLDCGTPCQIQNYMDYTPDACMSKFTQDQTDRMHTVLANSIRRTGIIAANNVSYSAAISIVTPNDGFICDATVPLYINISVTNTGYTSINTVAYTVYLDSTELITGSANVGGLATNNVAYFPAAQPVGLDAVTQGLHALSVNITTLDGNANGNLGTNSYSVYLYIIQNPVTSTSMNFEGISFFPPEDWAVVNNQGWSGYSGIPQATTGSTGISAVSQLYNIKTSGGQFTFFYLPGIYVSSSGLTISFDVSYALYTNGTYTQLGEGLQVILSPLCGDASDYQAFAKYDVDLSTAAATGQFYVPASSSDWRHESVTVSPASLIGQVVTVAFVTTGYYGNNIWLDNIVISSGSSDASTINGWTTLLQ